MTDEQMRKFRRDTLMDEWPKRCKTGLMCRACGVELEAYYCEEYVYLVRCAVCGTVALVEAFSPKEAAKKVGGKENERIRQTCVTHEAMQAVLDELEQVKRERGAAIFDLGECTRIKYSPNCSACKHDGKTCFESPCSECSKNHSKFEWRGVCDENGGLKI